MNITVGVAALSDRGRHMLPRLWEHALDLGGEAFDMTNASTKVTERRAVVNARNVEGTWDVPTWLSDQHSVVSVSQPPVSFTQEVPADRWAEWALATTREDSARRTIHPGYFGISLREDGGFEAWNDIFGFGRCYVVENEHFLAVGNHIGMVSLFADHELLVDGYGTDVLAQLGFWPEDRSPITSVRRLGPAEVIAVGQHDDVHNRRYSDPAEHFGAREPRIDYDEVAAALAHLTSNSGAIAKLPPTVHLSGGQDSRVTAAAWIAGGRPATLQTIGTLPGEVEIATQLVEALENERSMEERGLTHKVTKPNPRKLSQYSIEDRLSTAMLMWDGDFAPAKLRAPVQRPPAVARLAIGGANGEVMHGIHYPDHTMLAAVRELDHPLDRLEAAFPHKLQAPSTRESALAFFASQKSFTEYLGQHDATALNVFQMTSKFRRWVNAQLGSTSLTLLLNPVFVRAAVDLTPEERLDRVMQKALSRALVPQWELIPYYKATHQETTTAMKPQAIRTWQTSPGSMERLLHERSAWQRWFDRAKMLSVERAVHNGQGNSAHETTLNMAYVLDAIPDHVARLEKIRSGVWSG
ncbi:hypothetical protein ACFQS2_07650 [Brachybacterium sp. GCM10030267]|uniref:hypothetical protein n=1 Tax=Brachybacterium sp. GCM10030267 TaxID=3273381 RepID=UPI00361B2C75